MSQNLFYLHLHCSRTSKYKGIFGKIHQLVFCKKKKATYKGKSQLCNTLKHIRSTEIFLLLINDSRQLYKTHVPSSITAIICVLWKRYYIAIVLATAWYLFRIIIFNGKNYFLVCTFTATWVFCSKYVYRRS